MYYEQYSAVTWIVVPFYIITILFGGFGNVVVLRAYFSKELTRRTTYDFILASGVAADLIICVIFTPLLLVYRADEPAAWIENSPLCEMTVASSLAPISLQFLVFPLLSLNREDRTLRPLSPRLDKPRCKKLIAAAWLWCIAVSVCQIIILHATALPDNKPKLYRCIMVHHGLDAHSGFFLIYCSLLYVASITISVRSYARIYRFRGVTVGDAIDSPTSGSDVTRTKMCLALAIVYSIFWTPFFLLQLNEIFGNTTEVVFNCHALSSFLGVMASAVSPFLYSYKDDYYKKTFMNIFKIAQNEC